MENAEPVGLVPGDDVGEANLDQQVTLTVAAVAARLGVAPSTLRTWDRRYGLGPSGRAAGSHRRYTAEDVARLDTMRRLTLAGAAPSDAARVAASSAPALRAVPAGTPAAPEPDQPVFVDALTLAAAAANGEDSRVRRMVQWVVRERGIVGAWSEIGQPALAYLADRDPADKPGRVPESSLAAAVLGAARSCAEDAPPPRDRRCCVVLVADPASQADHLGAHVLAAALAEREVLARVVSAGRDPARVRRAVEAPTTTVVAVVGDPPAGLELARESAERPDVAVFMVGAGVADVWLPGVHRVRTFEGAIHEMVGALDAAVAAQDDDPRITRGPRAADGRGAGPS